MHFCKALGSTMYIKEHFLYPLLNILNNSLSSFYCETCAWKSSDVNINQQKATEDVPLRDRKLLPIFLHLLFSLFRHLLENLPLLKGRKSGWLLRIKLNDGPRWFAHFPALFSYLLLPICPGCVALSFMRHRLLRFSHVLVTYLIITSNGRRLEMVRLVAN